MVFPPVFLILRIFLGFPDGSVIKNMPANAGDDAGLISGSGRSSGEENGYPLQYSCLENSVDRGAWWAIVHGAAKESDMTERLTHTHTLWVGSVVV